ncbi:MAG: carbohydrate kinase, partial [Actinobacteria bacterium]|nr:carbohydrate kinase [Actinomycetota bacterium]
PAAVVVTRGGDGPIGVTATGRVARPAPAVEVVDTVGAGDAFMSGLLDGLLRRGRLTPSGLDGIDPATDLAAVLGDAALVAAITCSRAGANPPRRAEVDSWDGPR